MYKLVLISCILRTLVNEPVKSFMRYVVCI